ncbi:MAG: hypothetical protein D084_Lepto4C00404G0003 [Leptospirillum sp. Group IV 'UBA BS']|nr:MAG: hypothetical protein D084_Lepto4C00404G0003 [Leptospirillum sp. Group IV 'UBA BS']
MSRNTRTKEIKNTLPLVHLVGAGPGDPGLLTRKGAQVLGTADVILYDHLVPLELLDLAPPQALLIDVGKVRNHPRMTQAEIEETMIEHARKGRRVVRLKGGDPFVFGRGGEEAQALNRAGISFSVIPGISSPIAVPAYAGVPVTHRDYNSRLVILTAHDNPAEWSKEDLAALSGKNQTLVILMGVMYMKQLAERLLQAGLSPETPVLLVRWGTTAKQESAETTLGNLPGFLDRTPFSPPVTLLIGDVVRLRSQISWTHRLPLFGKRILLTRERETSKELATLLESLGATVVSCPTISVIPGLSENAGEKIAKLGDYSWLVFLSPNGVRNFMRELAVRKQDVRSLAGLRIFSMGPTTSEALESFGIYPDAAPGESHGQGVLDAFSSLPEPRKGKILLVRGDRGSGLIPEGLSSMGFTVDIIGVYENVLPAIPSYKRDRMESLIEEGTLDLAIYYSPSAFSGLLETFPSHRAKILSIPALAIGPTTEGALKGGSVSKIIRAATPTTSGILDAALDFLAPMGNNSEIMGNSPDERSPAVTKHINPEEQPST